MLDDQGFKEKLWLFPFIGSIVLFLSCVIPYFISLYMNQIDWFLPLVSDTGTHPPAANIFSQLIIICNFLLFIGGWVRYKQMKYCLNKYKATMGDKKDMENSYDLLHRINFYSFLYCLPVCLFGYTLLANFRDTEALSVHIFGTILVFVGLSPYLLANVYLCYKIQRIESPPVTMAVATVLILFSITVCGLCTLVSTYFQHWTDIARNEFRINWTPDMDGYLVFRTFAFFEWLIVFSSCCFFLCLAKRLKVFQHWDQISF